MAVERTEAHACRDFELPPRAEPRATDKVRGTKRSGLLGLPSGGEPAPRSPHRRPPSRLEVRGVIGREQKGPRRPQPDPGPESDIMARIVQAMNARGLPGRRDAHLSRGGGGPYHSYPFTRLPTRVSPCAGPVEPCGERDVGLPWRFPSSNGFGRTRGATNGRELARS